MLYEVITIKDVAGNSSKLIFNVQSKPISINRPAQSDIVIPYNRSFNFEKDGLLAQFKAGSYNFV